MVAMPAALVGKKVLFVNRFFYPDHSATSQILSDLAFDLADSGVRVEVIASRLRYDNSGDPLPAEETVHGVRVHRVWTSRFGRDGLVGRAIDYSTFYATAMVTLWRSADRDSVVVVKTDPPLFSLFAAPVARIRGAIRVNWLQDLFPEVAAVLRVPLVKGRFLMLLRWLRNLTLSGAQVNVVLGERMKALVHAQGVEESRIRVIHNWADGDAIRPVPPGENRLRADWGLRDRFVVGYSGNFGRAHEFETIVRCAEALQDRPEIVFLFVGGGAQRAAVEQEALARNLDNVRFAPYQPRERLSESLGLADVHLVSLHPELEGMIVPSKFYGIAAAGRPAIFIGDGDGEIARILRQYDCGRSIAVGDPHSLAEAVAELWADRELCLRQGRNARKVAEQRFNRNIALQEWQSALAAAAS